MENLSTLTSFPINETGQMAINVHSQFPSAIIDWAVLVSTLYQDSHDVIQQQCFDGAMDVFYSSLIPPMRIHKLISKCHRVYY